MSEPGMGPILPGCLRPTRHSQSAMGPWDWGFDTVRGGVGPGELDFRPRGVGACRDTEGRMK